MRATPRQPTSVGTCPLGKSSATGRRRRLQPVSAVASGRSGAEFGPCAKRARSTSDGGYDRAKHRMFGFNPSGLTSGLTVHASYLTSGLASYQASGLIQNHVQNLRRTTLEAAAARAKSVRPADTPGRPKRIRDHVLQMPTTDTLNRDTGRRTDGRRTDGGVHVWRRLPPKLRSAVCGLRGQAQPSAARRCSTSVNGSSNRGD